MQQPRINSSEHLSSSHDNSYILRVSHNEQEQIFPIQHGKSIIGCDTDSDIQLNSPLISACQATLNYFVDGRIQLLDGDGINPSANGTYVNDLQIQSCWLKIGSVIRFGQSEIHASLLALKDSLLVEDSQHEYGRSPIRVLIADDQKTVLKILRLLLEQELDIEVVGVAVDGQDALEKIQALSPDVALIDLQMPGIGGLEALRIARQRFPKTKVIVLTTHNEESYINQAFLMGANGYLFKTIGKEELTRSIRSVNEGFVQLSPGVFEKLLPVVLSSINNIRNQSPQGSELPTTLPVNYKLSSRESFSGSSDSIALSEHSSSFTSVAASQAANPSTAITQPLPDFLANPERRKVLLLTFLIIGSLTLVGLVLRRQFLHNLSRQLVDIPVLPVVAEPIELVSSFNEGRIFTGEIVANRASELSFARAGQIELVFVDEGDTVAEGMPLAKLDTRDLELEQSQLQAELAEAQSELQELTVGPRAQDIAAARAAVQALQEKFELAQSRQQRRAGLLAEGAISQEQLEEAIAEAEELQARMQESQSQLDRLLAGTRSEQIAAQQARVQQIQVSIERVNLDLVKSTLLAPFAAHIGSRNVNEGSTVEPSQAAFRLLETGSNQVRIGVPVSTIAQFHENSQHEIWVGERSFPARVTAISPELDSQTLTIPVIFDFEENTDLSSGQIARLELAQTIFEEGYWLPTTALVPGERGLWGVYSLIKDDSLESTPLSPNNLDENLYQVKRQAVEILFAEEERAFVRGTLDPGMQIVVDGTQRIVADQWVRLSS